MMISAIFFCGNRGSNLSPRENRPNLCLLIRILPRAVQRPKGPPEPAVRGSETGDHARPGLNTGMNDNSTVYIERGVASE